MKNFKILSKEIVLKEIDNSHHYFVGDRYYCSTTHILDMAGPKEYGLLNFFKQNTPEQIEQIKTETGDFGSLMHDAFEKLLYGVELKSEDYPERGKKIITQFQDWFSILRPTQYLPEHTVAWDSLVDGVDRDERFAGTLDLLATVDVENLYKIPNLFSKSDIAAKPFGDKKSILVLIDFKTTSGIYFSHKLQVAAYSECVRQMYSQKPDFIGIARFGTRHACGYEMKQVKEVTFDHFLGVLRTFKSMNGGKLPDPPEINVYPETFKLVDADPKEAK